MSKEIPTETTEKPEYDATQAMIERCAPIVKLIMESMLKDNLLLADSKYIQAECIRQMESVFRNVVVDHMNMVFKLMQDTINISLEQASAVYWGKPIDEVTFGDVEAKFKKE